MLAEDSKTQKGAKLAEIKEKNNLGAEVLVRDKCIQLHVQNVV
jgi:hypothetical protein